MSPIILYFKDATHVNKSVSISKPDTKIWAQVKGQVRCPEFQLRSLNSSKTITKNCSVSIVKAGLFSIHMTPPVRWNPCRGPGAGRVILVCAAGVFCGGGCCCVFRCSLHITTATRTTTVTLPQSE